MRSFRDHVATRLEDLRARTLLREPVISDVPTGTHVVVNGERLLNLASNDYLGLAGEPWLREALRVAASRWGGAGASRLITGSLAPHLAAEHALAELVRQPAALLFSSGYAANVGAVAGLVGPDDVVFSDALNHASLIDGCRLSRARVVVYPHRDLASLEQLLARHRPAHRAALVVTDAVFSMDADLAPLAALRALADRHDAGLLVDEAHALGVLGPEGRGACAAANVAADVTTGMLGKALGLQGGFVAGPADTRRLLQSTARSYVFSTGVHAALAAVVPAAVRWVVGADDARARGRRHRERLASAARVRDTGEVPVLPILLGEPAPALRVAAALRRRGVLAPAIRPPTVPVGTARLRVVPMASHDDADIARAADTLREVLDAEIPPDTDASRGGSLPTEMQR